jgi:hypothetical protein
MSINRMVASSQMRRADCLGYRTIILAHMICKKLGAKSLSKASCLGFGFEGLDFVTDALVGSAACPFGLEWDWFIDVWEATDAQAQFSCL